MEAPPLARPLGRLHLVTDERLADPLPTVRAAVAAAASAPGELVVQVRPADHRTDRQAYDLVRRAVDLCARYGVTCLVNDRVDVALATGAAGAHVGADDLPVAATRGLCGPAAVVGATARTPRAARDAVADGATYLGVGPAFNTSTKAGLPAALGPAGIAAVAAAVPRVPVIAIGGVTADRVPQLLAAGAYGVAVVSAISAAADPGAATRYLLAALAADRPARDGARFHPREVAP